MKTSNLTLTAAGIIGILCSVAASAYAHGISAQDFVQKASVANEFEIESSKLALSKSKNGDIKKFAKAMINDHTESGDKLEDTLRSSSSGATLSDEVDGKHQRLLDALKAASGKNFDSKYISMQTDAHKQAVKLFSDYAQSGEDPALKNFAAQTLPTLEKHLHHVEKLHAK